MADYSWITWTSSSATTTLGTWELWWERWMSGTAATTSTITSSGTWASWTTGTANYQPTPLTAEQHAVAQRAEEEWAARHQRAQKEAIKATRKARALLESCLTRRQRTTLRREQFFDVRAIRPDGQATVYRIEQGSSGNVFEVDADGRKVRRFCIHPAGVPAADAMLAQKLLLETDPAAFERIANITPLRRSA